MPHRDAKEPMTTDIDEFEHIFTLGVFRAMIFRDPRRLRVWSFFVVIILVTAQPFAARLHWCSL